MINYGDIIRYANKAIILVGKWALLSGSFRWKTRQRSLCTTQSWLAHTPLTSNERTKPEIIINGMVSFIFEKNLFKKDILFGFVYLFLAYYSIWSAPIFQSVGIIVNLIFMFSIHLPSWEEEVEKERGGVGAVRVESWWWISAQLVSKSNRIVWRGER